MGNLVCRGRYCSLRSNVHNHFLISHFRLLPIALLLLAYSWQHQPSLSPSSVCLWDSLKSFSVLLGIPGSDVNLEIQLPGIQLIEGEDLFFICSVANGTGTVTFSWHWEGSEKSLGRKMQRALSAKLQIATVREQDAGRYYCSADNMHGPILSKWIRVTLRSKSLIPFTQPCSQARV